jgi:hypothetical protein
MGVRRQPEPDMDVPPFARKGGAITPATKKGPRGPFLIVS